MRSIKRLIIMYSLLLLLYVHSNVKYQTLHAIQTLQAIAGNSKLA